MTTRSYDITIPYGYDAYRKIYRRSYGSNTPRSLRQQGEYQENPYDITLEDYRSGVLGLSFQPEGNIWWAGTVTVGASPIFDACPAPAWVDVLPRLLSKWRESEFNLGITVGEGRESVTLMTDRLRSLASCAGAIRKKDLGGALRHVGKVPKDARRRAQKKLDAEDLSGAFLEIHLGWSPLIRDIDALAGMIKLDPTHKVFRTSFTLKQRTGRCAGGGLPPERAVIVKNDRTRYVKVTLTHQPSLPERLGLTNVAGIVWGLTSCSFVADYILPIGVTLEALHAQRVLPVKKLVYTDVYRYEGYVAVTPGQLVGGMYARNPAVGSRKGIVMSRKVLDGMPSALAILEEVPTRSLSWTEPSLKKLATASALAHSRIKSLERGYKAAQRAARRAERQTPQRVYTSADFTNVKHRLR